MGDTNVKIKLTADGKQVRDEIKLIDRDIQELGGTNKTPKKGSKSKENSQDNQQGNNQQPKKDSRETAKQEMRDKTNQKLTRELTLIRKELQKMNGTSGYGGGQSSAPPTPPSGGSNDNNSQNPPTSPDDNSGNKKLLDVLGKLGTAVGVFKALSGAFNYISQGAASSRSAESLAYKTYGSTLAYDDYYTAKKDAYSLGYTYGYDYKETMGAASANMAKAGFTNLDNYNADMNAILGGAKAWGYDPNTLADASGYMTSIGVTESGDQQKFVNMLSRSIVDAQMTGREDEQLRVLEEIAESLGQVNTSVSQKNVNDQLNMYNSLVDQNENLKGSRGSGLMTTMSSLAQSGDTSLDILAGMNTKYTGKEGYIELRKLAEENPTEYWKQVIQGARSYGMSDTDIQYKMLMKGLSTSQIEDYFSALDNVENFDSSDTTLGEEEIQKRLDNWNNSDAAIYEQNDIQKQDAKESAGDFLGNNPIANWWRKTYNNMPSWARGALGVGGEVAKGVGLIGGTKLVGKWLGKGGSGSGGVLSGLGSKVKSWFGKGGASGAADDVAGAASGAADDVAAAAANGTDDIVSAAANSADDAANAMGSVADDIANAGANSVDDAANALANSTDDLINAASNSVDDVAGAVAGAADDIVANTADDLLGSLGNGAKELLKNNWLGSLVQLGFGAYNYATADDDWERSEAVGRTGGGIIGQIIGSVAGPLGSMAGSWAGGELGDAIGNSAETGKKGWGSIFAGDWNPLNGLWRKKGTLVKQEIEKEQSDLSSRYTGGKPSDYGLPEDFDNALNYYEFGDDVHADLKSGVLKNQYGYSQEDLDKIYESQAFTNWLDSQGRVQHIDTSNYGVGAGGDFGIDTGGEAKMVVVAKDFGDYQDKYDASKDTLNQGYYSVWTGTQEQLEEYKKNRGQMMVGSDYWERAETVGATEENPYMQGSSSEAVSDNTTAIEENTEALKQLYENNGLTWGAPYSNEYIDSTLKSNQQNTTPLNPFSSNSKTSGSLFGNAFSWLFGGKSHATGNDYVPYDNYPSLLHQGEMVLTKQEADDYRQGKVDQYGNILNGGVNGNGGKSHATGTIDINIHFDGSVDGMSIDNQNKMMEMVKQQFSGVNLQSLLSNGYQRIQNC